MEDLSLHILDIVENSVASGAHNVGIIVSEDRSKDLMTVMITDDGKGMSAEAITRATDPFYTTRTTRRVGFGLGLFKEAARIANGQLDIRSSPGAGTTVTATFQLSNIDRKPLGDMASTLVTLIAGNPGVHFAYRHERDGEAFVLDTEELRDRLGGVSTNTPEVLSFVRKFIAEHSGTSS
jgi:anti-sigma regulatory factor (Ser/Thr protein kinase)